VAVYVIQAGSHDAAALARARMIPDRFSWAAFILAQVWLLYHRLWLALGIWIVLEVAFFLLIYPHVSIATTVLTDGLAHLYIGFEGNSLRIARDARGAGLTDVVAGEDRDAAERTFFRRYAPQEIGASAEAAP
jgi:hypothetical protein